MKIGTVALMSAGMVTAVSHTGSAQTAPAGRRMAAYAEMLFGAKISPASRATLNNIKGVLAGGLCCDGCGCNQPLIPVGETMRR